MPVIVLRAEIAAALLVALALTGCARGSGVDTAGGPLPSATSTATPSVSSSASPRPQTTSTSPSSPPISALTTSAILTQYRAFFATLTPASKASPAGRFAMMQKVAVEPALTRVLGGIAAIRRNGQVGYGADVIRPRVAKVDGASATVTDCQDTSGFGRVEVATGKKVTVGVKNTLATVNMQRGVDGAWRVSTVKNAPAGSCNITA